MNDYDEMEKKLSHAERNPQIETDLRKPIEGLHYTRGTQQEVENLVMAHDIFELDDAPLQAESYFVRAGTNRVVEFDSVTKAEIGVYRLAPVMTWT